MAKRPNTTLGRHAKLVADTEKKLQRLGWNETQQRTVYAPRSSFLEKAGKLAITGGGLALIAAAVFGFQRWRASDEAVASTRNLNACTAESAEEPCTWEVSSTAMFPSHDDPSVGVKGMLTYILDVRASAESLANNAGKVLVVDIDSAVDPQLYAQTEISQKIKAKDFNVGTHFNILNDQTLPFANREVNYQICKNELIVLSNGVRRHADDFANDQFPAAVIADPTITHLYIDYSPHTETIAPATDQKIITFQYNGGVVDCVKPTP